jgi:hypothetical protein
VACKKKSARDTPSLQPGQEVKERELLRGPQSFGVESWAKILMPVLVINKYPA